MLSLLRRVKADFELPAAARRARAADRAPLGDDIGAHAAIGLGLAWLGRAQDHSASRDGGFARDYDMIKGWATSYPETSGYIVPTMIDAAREHGRADYEMRARACLDWLVTIQFPEGGFQGGRIDQTPKVPVTFNTGQILLGLAAGTAHLDRDRYLEPMRRAAVWLRDSLDADGCWRQHATPFAKPGEKAYETHVSWGLFEAERVAPGEGFAAAGYRQVAWALTKQQPNGWFASNDLEDPRAPLTHTIGYVLRGVVEAWRLSTDPMHLVAALCTARSLARIVDAEGRLAGKLDSNWQPAAPWVCLTGSVQIAHSLFLLAAHAPELAAPACRLNSYVRRTIQLDGTEDRRGGIKGSHPIDGGYGRWQYLNWAAKFMIDAQRAELAHATTTTTTPTPTP